MPQLTYSFTPDIFRNPKNQRLEYVYRPYLNITLGIGGKWDRNSVRAMHDTGADRNLFPAAFARSININVEAGRKSEHTGIGGFLLHAYSHTVKIKVNEKVIETAVDFSDQVTIPLLGRDGFFVHFKKISFDVKQKTFELKY